MLDDEASDGGSVEGRPRIRRGGDNDEERARKRQRQVKRELQPLPAVGLGCGSVDFNWIWNCLRIYSSMPCPWWARPDIKRGMYDTSGPFNQGDMARWVQDRDKQLTFAQNFHVPWKADWSLRTLDSDQLTEGAKYFEDATSRVLFALAACNVGCPINLPRSPEVQNAIVPQFSGDVWSCRRLLGAAGGPAGCDWWTIWNLKVSEDWSTPDDFLALVSIIAAGLSGACFKSGETFWPGVNTRFTDLEIAAKQSKLVGARVAMERNYELREKYEQRHSSTDVDEVLLGRIVEFREAGDGAAVIDPAQCVCDPALAHKSMPAVSENITEHVFSGLFDLYLHSDVYTGVNADGTPAHIKLDCLRIRNKFPGVDAAVAVSHMLRSSSFPELPGLLLSSMKHMCGLVMGTSAVSLDQLFSTTDSSTFTTLTCEANIPLSVFRLAEDENISDISVGGMRIDVKSSCEVRAYQEYLHLLYDNRSEHFKQVLREVVVDCGPGGMRQCNRPLESLEPHLGVGIHYRSMPVANFQNFLVSVREMNSEYGEDDWNELMDNFCAEVLCDTENVYIPVGGGLINSGVLLPLNPLNFVGESRDKRLKASSVGATLMQPARLCKAMSIYLSNRMETVDPHASFFEEGGPIADKIYITLTKNVTVAVLQLRTMYQEGIDRTNMREKDLWQLYGSTPHPLHEQLDNVHRECELQHMAGAWHTTFVTAFREGLDLMLTGELVQHQHAAASVFELRKQSSVYDSSFKDQLILLSQGAKGVIDRDSRIALMGERCKQFMDMDICWCNMELMKMLVHAALCLFCGMKRAWGATIWVSDMGQSSAILGLETNARSRHVWYVDSKAPSMGADAVNETLGQLYNGYGAFCCTDARLRGFYSSPDCRDISGKYASAMSMATMWGSGMMRNSSGAIVDVKYRREAGCAGIFTELLKVDATGDTAQNIITNIEAYLANSGRGMGLRDEAWSTTKAMDGLSIDSKMPLPLTMMCGNRPSKRTPASIRKGGRVRIVNTSVLDTVDTGIVAIGNGRVQSQDRRDVNLRSLILTPSERGPIRVVTKELANQNRFFFLIRHIVRKPFPYLHRTLTLDFIDMQYTMRLTLRHIFINVSSLTEGLRRGYLADLETLSRTFHGPFRTASLYPEHAEQMIWDSVTQELERAMDTSECVDLYNAFMASCQACLQVPTSFSAIMNALFAWLSQTVLDANIMVLSCFQLYTLNWQEGCPLVILALAASGGELSPDQKKIYDEWCKYMLPLVTAPSTNQNELQAWRNNENGPRLLPVTALVMPSDRDLDAWLAGEDAVCQREYLGRRNGTVSTYVSCRMDFWDSAPHWFDANVEDRGDDQRQGSSSRTPKRRKKFVDEYATGSPEAKVAQMFADAQTAEAAEKRAKERAPMPYENVCKFWDAACKGTRLPRQDRKSSDEKFDVAFDPVYETGFWYRDVLRTLGTASGPIRQFMVMCGCTLETSRLDLFKRLLKPYMNEHPEHQGRIFINNDTWKEPILKLQGHGIEVVAPAVKWMCLPRRSAVDGTWNGVQVGLCPDVLWMTVAQGLFCMEWRRVDHDTRNAVVHLRNMGGATRGLLELMLHTMVERAAVPAGSIFLSHSDPECVSRKEYAPIELKFYPELHSDCFIDNSYDRFGFLCIQSRSPIDVVWSGEGMRHKFARLVFEDNAVGFQYPPESVMHMQCQLQAMAPLLHRMSSVYADRPFNLPLALRLYGSSVTSAVVQPLRIHFTEVSLWPGMEIPCMTYREGWLFVLAVGWEAEQAMLRVIPVERTHFTDDDEAARMDKIAFDPLPLAEHAGADLVRPERLRVGDTLMITTEGEVSTDGPGEPVPFSPMPIIQHDHLALVRIDRKFLKTADGTQLRVEHAEVLFESQSAYHYGPGSEQYERWKRENANLQVNESLLMVDLFDAWSRDLDDDDMNVDERLKIQHDRELTRFWIVREQEGKKLYFYFNSCSHLKYVLDKNAGQACSDVYLTRLCEPMLLVTTELTGNASTSDGNTFFHLYRSKDDIPVVIFEAASFSDSKRLEIQRMVDQYVHNAEKVSAKIYELTRTLTADGNSVEDRDKLNAEIDQHRTRLAELTKHEKSARERLAKCGVQKIESSKFIIPQPFQMTSVCVPPDVTTPWSEQDDAEFGMVVRHDPKKPFYLKDGDYAVAHRCPITDEDARTRMDFMSLSLCLIPELYPLYVLLTPRLYAAVLSQLSARVPEPLQHSELLEQIEADSVVSNVGLVAYYVLDNDSRAAFQAPDFLINVFVICHQVEYSGVCKYTNAAQCNVKVRVRLYDDDGEALVTLRPPEASVGHLVPLDDDSAQPHIQSTDLLLTRV